MMLLIPAGLLGCGDSQVERDELKPEEIIHLDNISALKNYTFDILSNPLRIIAVDKQIMDKIYVYDLSDILD